MMHSQHRGAEPGCAMACTMALCLMLGALMQSGKAVAQSAFDEAFRAVEVNAVNDLKRLLARGIDPNTADRDGMTLLARAAEAGSRDVANVLLASGARADARNRFGESPLMYAALRGHEGIVRDMLTRQAQVNPEAPAWSALHYAALRGHVGIIDVLLERGANVNSVSENGTTPLMLAASEGRLEAVQRLLKRGADPRLESDGARTATWWALQGDHRKVADLLAASGAP